jgi:uncharacterized protein (DUF1330 family)
MLYLLVHIYIHLGQEQAFQNYENQVLSIFKSHGGKVIVAFRPEVPANNSGDDVPYEIHVLSLPSEEAFLAYRNDPLVLDLKESRLRIFRKMDIFKSSQTISY